MRPRLSTSNFKEIRGLCVALSAAVIFIAAYIALGELYEYAAGQNVVNHYNRLRFEEFYATPPDTLDWVFMGSSHAYCTFDPANFEAYGISSFQMGMPLQLPDGTYYTLREVLNHQSPGTVVLELYWYVMEQDFDAKQMEMLFQVMQNEALKSDYLREVLPWNEKIKFALKPVRYQEDFFAFVNSKLLNVIQYRLGLRRTFEQRPGTEFYKGRGYVVYDFEMTRRQIDAAASSYIQEMHGWQPAPSQAYYLDKIVQLCAQNDIELVLVTAPVSVVQFGRLRNYQAFHDAIAAYAARHDLPYLDFNLVNEQEKLFTNAHFFDAGHLNDTGVKIANAYFMAWYEGLGE
jgi:archaellum component FlaF (FlaF/FlaG flagellin family)